MDCAAAGPPVGTFENFLRGKWFDGQMASLLRAHVRTQIFELMLDQAPEQLKDTEAYASMQEERDQYKRLVAL
jgi:hypothetical protein